LDPRAALRLPFFKYLLEWKSVHEWEGDYAGFIPEIAPNCQKENQKDNNAN